MPIGLPVENEMQSEQAMNNPKRTLVATGGSPVACPRFANVSIARPLL